jgi:hypothetical protein
MVLVVTPPNLLCDSALLHSKRPPTVLHQGARGRTSGCRQQVCYGLSSHLHHTQVHWGPRERAGAGGAAQHRTPLLQGRHQAINRAHNQGIGGGVSADFLGACKQHVLVSCRVPNDHHSGRESPEDSSDGARQ